MYRFAIILLIFQFHLNQALTILSIIEINYVPKSILVGIDVMVF